ncbi:DUF1838 family protein [Streptomyces sp. NPDC012888]|uniref:DUF1838 family protein n=1 Tax=Streptomyces sp. NPDC012888 TaxID=3364855 RepID=UPI00367F8269
MTSPKPTTSTTPATPAETLRAFARTRAALDGSEVTFHWTGDVHSFGPQEDYRHLFGFEGVNVSRLVPDETGTGYRLLTREAAAYLDPRTREILDTWQDKKVVHVWNDPANLHLRPFPIPTTDLGDQLCFSLEIPLSYPSPLPVAEYPANSADDTYRALELFQFFAPADVLTTGAPSVPATMTWTRMSPWLPWMEQGPRPGGLVFHCRGRKLGPSETLPERLHRHITAHHPEFTRAPERWTEPNESSWTYFRRMPRP